MEELRLGSRTLQPGRQLLADGERVPLGKRALDILSVLAEAHGEIVTKDELLEAVWPGVIVEENALQVHIVALRKALGPEADRLKTIRGVGYQLTLQEHADGEGMPGTNGERHIPASHSNFARHRIPGKLWIAMAVGTVFLATVLVWIWPPQSEALRVQVVALQPQGGANANRLAGTLQDDIVGVLSQSGVQTTDNRQSGLFPSSSQGGVVLKGSVVEAGGRLQVRLLLDDVKSGLTLWSDRFESPVDSADLLTDQATVAATETVLTILEISQQKGFTLGPKLTALYLRAEELTRSPQFLSEGVPRKLFEQIVREAPGFAAGHALLALSLTGEVSRAGPSDSTALIDRARNELNTAIRIDPYAAGAAYDARFGLDFLDDKPHPIKTAEDGLLEGLRRAPDFAFLSMRECRLLVDLGRVHDALPYCQRAIAQRPLAGPIGHTNARALSVAGQRELAKSAIDRAARFNPDQTQTRVTRLALAAFYASPDEAAALLHNPATVPPGMSEQLIEAFDSFLLARRTGKPEDIEKAAAAVGTAARSDARYLDFAVKALTALGRIDQAFALMGPPNLEGFTPRTGTAFLFEPVTAPLRADRRFWPVAARLGLVQYWTERDKWPDFCGDEIPLDTCKMAATLALSAAKAA
ncbi:MAG: winged helix-turn-helix domain-containing protein [Croceibacterium sp.]